VLRTPYHRLARVLHWALGLLILVEGAFNLAHGLASQRDLQLVAFGTAEAVGAILFAWSRTIAVGACVLVCAFLLAAGVHVLHRDLPIEHLVYAVAV
jgi:cytochrome b561